MEAKSFVIAFTGEQLAHITWLCRNQLSEISKSVLIDILPIINQTGRIGSIPVLTLEERNSLVNSAAYKERHKRIKNES